ncbi:hypothetical protein B296_00028138 [Ensete ventricosum]|uniref:Uncharacterized protein n=1 Tax=Ensete ventricosum TaxID=4639 RepID=A0A426Z429_ENSVE|nr:hypothetical protein B296_00028138 [Ensete ventricosum]
MKAPISHNRTGDNTSKAKIGRRERRPYGSFGELFIHGDRSHQKPRPAPSSACVTRPFESRNRWPQRRWKPTGEKRTARGRIKMATSYLPPIPESEGFAGLDKTGGERINGDGTGRIESVFN